MIETMLRNTLRQIANCEQHNPDEARRLAPVLPALKFQIETALQYIEGQRREAGEEARRAG